MAVIHRKKMNRHHNNTLGKAEKEWFAWGLVIITVCSLYIVATIVMSSCSPSVKMAKFEHKHPFYVAEFCANRYPTHDSVTTVTVFKKGETIFDTSFVQVDCDSAIKYNTRFVNVPKFIQKLRVDTFTNSKTIVVKSGAELAQIAILKNDLSKSKESRNWWLKFALIEGISIALFLAWKIFVK